MNDSARSFVNARRFGRASTLLAATGFAALLSGCISNPLAEAKVDPASPIAAEVTKLAHANTDYPSFSEIPAAPTDVRPVKMFGQAANDLALEAAKLEQATAPETWALKADTDAFAAKAQREVGPDLPPAESRNTEAYAADLRKRATPPPPPKR